MTVTLNDKDVFTTYNLKVLEKGLDTFFIMPKRKDSLISNSLDRDGIEVDLVAPKFEAREFNLDCFLYGFGSDIDTAIADFWNKYDGLFTELSRQGTHQLNIDVLGKTFNVFYKELTGFDKYNKLVPTAEGVYVKFTIVFGETNPNDNIKKVYLVDDQDRYLIE